MIFNEHKIVNTAITVIILAVTVIVIVFILNMWDPYKNDMSIYDSILDNYRTGFQENWTIADFSEKDLCYLCGYYDSSEVGYLFKDIDKNGTRELLIGRIPDEDYASVILDMYTIIEGKPVRVFSSYERDRFYICSDNTFKNEGSGGAMFSSYYFYKYKGGSELTFVDAVIYDAYYDELSPWFYCNTQTEYDNGAYCSEEDYQPVSEEEARDLIDSHVEDELSYTPFSE